MKQTDKNTEREFLGVEHPILTLAKARELCGKSIRLTFPVAEGNCRCVYEATISEIVNRYELAGRTPREGWASQAEFLDEEMPQLASEWRDTYVILDGGDYTGMFCLCTGLFDEPTFTAGDADRPVTFEVI